MLGVAGAGRAGAHHGDGAATRPEPRAEPGEQRLELRVGSHQSHVGGGSARLQGADHRSKRPYGGVGGRDPIQMRLEIPAARVAGERAARAAASVAPRTACPAPEPSA
jgi:hypothetical protein